MPGLLCVICEREPDDPVVSRVDGRLYHHTCIMGWIKREGSVCPVTRNPLNPSRDLLPVVHSGSSTRTTDAPTAMSMIPTVQRDLVVDARLTAFLLRQEILALQRELANACAAPLSISYRTPDSVPTFEAILSTPLTTAFSTSVPDVVRETSSALRASLTSQRAAAVAARRAELPALATARPPRLHRRTLTSMRALTSIPQPASAFTAVATSVGGVAIVACPLPPTSAERGSPDVASQKSPPDTKHSPTPASLVTVALLSHRAAASHPQPPAAVVGSSASIIVSGSPVVSATVAARMSSPNALLWEWALRADDRVVATCILGHADGKVTVLDISSRTQERDTGSEGASGRAAAPPLAVSIVRQATLFKGAAYVALHPFLEVVVVASADGLLAAYTAPSLDLSASVTTSAVGPLKSQPHTCVAIHPDGELIAVGRGDGTVAVVSLMSMASPEREGLVVRVIGASSLVEGLQPSLRIDAPFRSVPRSVCFSLGGTSLCVGCGDGHVGVVNLRKSEVGVLHRVRYERSSSWVAPVVVAAAGPLAIVAAAERDVAALCRATPIVVSGSLLPDIPVGCGWVPDADRAVSFPRTGHVLFATPTASVLPRGCVGSFSGAVSCVLMSRQVDCVCS